MFLYSLVAIALKRPVVVRQLHSSIRCYLSSQPEQGTTRGGAESSAAAALLHSNSISINDHFHFTEASVAVVSTASRGIGLELASQLLMDTPATIVGLYRSPRSIDIDTPLYRMKQVYNDRLRLVQIDLENQGSVDQACSTITSAFKRVDLLINVAGMLGDKSSAGPERSITAMDRDWLTKTFDVNLVGHVMLTKGIWSALVVGSKDAPTRVVNISARVGSISDNRLGGWYSYRMSKAALNMFTKSLSIEGKRKHCIVLSMHPGTTDTDLSKPFQSNVSPDKLFSAQFSVSMMLSVVSQATIDSSGKFFAYDGTEIPY